MKTSFKIALFSSALTLAIISCNDPGMKEKESPFEVEKTKLVSFKNLKASMPEEFPDKLIEYGPGDLEYIALTGSKKQSARTVVEGTSFNEIVEAVRGKYPSFDEFIPSSYRPYFPDLSEEKILENSETVLEYMEKIMGYEVAIAVAALPDGGNLRVASPGDEANSCEIWYYANNLRLDMGGIELAKEKAPHYTNIYYGSGAAVVDHTLPNSFMHAVWNILLGKHAAYRYSEVWKAREVVRGLTDAHECNSDNDQKQMDLHNNDVGLQYFTIYAERYKKNLVDHNVRLEKTPQEYCDYVYGTVTNKISRGTPVSANNVTRVYYD